MCQWELLGALVGGCCALRSSNPAQAGTQRFHAWYCCEKDIPLQRLRYVFDGCWKVAGKPRMFCLQLSVTGFLF